MCRRQCWGRHQRGALRRRSDEKAFRIIYILTFARTRECGLGKGLSFRQ
nr:MAG TPA: hypothetical protein [Caudoviricetes sp.]DAS64155.1 MAG TPA: hypothetical protein [Caudoviricetes sp.]